MRDPSDASRYAILARRVAQAHDAQLLRDLHIINARTVRELGPLPPGGLPVQPKRKPRRAPWQQPVQELPALDTDTPVPPSPDIEDPDMFKRDHASNENPLPSPPVPQKLRELLKDYPELIERLQNELNYAVQHPSKVTPPFE